MKFIATVLALMLATFSTASSWPEDWARREGRAIVKQLMPFEFGKCLGHGTFDNF